MQTTFKRGKQFVVDKGKIAVRQRGGAGERFLRIGR